MTDPLPRDSPAACAHLATQTEVPGAAVPPSAIATAPPRPLRPQPTAAMATHFRRRAAWAAAAVAVAAAAGIGRAAGLGNGLGLAPPMGWNSWNSFGADATEKDIKEAATFIINMSLKDAGYRVVVVDGAARLGRVAPQACCEPSSDLFSGTRVSI